MSSDDAPKSTDRDSSIKRVGGIKLVVRSKTKKSRKRKLAAATRGLPAAAQGQQDMDSPCAREQKQQQQDDYNIPIEEEEEEEEEDIPCDTLLAMRSIERTRQCLDVPLYSGTVPCVLESQLHHKLQTETGEDLVVTSEIQQLVLSNSVRRLSSPSASGELEALMETRHYKRAVWDAHRHYGKADPAVTTGFLSCLEHVTKRRISQTDLRQHWPARWNDDVLDTLVKMQVLLPQDNAYISWLPHWGTVLKELSKGQAKVIQQLKRSLYKELSKSQVERIHHSGLSGAFVLHTLVAQGMVELKERPSDTFVRIAR